MAEQRILTNEILVVLFLAACAAVTGLIAAWYWYQSSKIPVETTQPDARTWDAAALGLAASTLQACQRVATLNKKAALWTMASVVSSAATTLAGAFLPSN